MMRVPVASSLRALTGAVLLFGGVPGVVTAQGTPPRRPSVPAPTPATTRPPTSAAAASAAQPATGRGRLTGRVLDAASGQGVADAQINIVGTPFGARTDLDGRYTMLNVPFGTYAVAAKRLGYQPKQYDKVPVTTTDATVVNFTIGTAAVALQSVTVRATTDNRTASEASLLAAQQKAAAASDGVSAEQIKRTPDSNAGEAATRVSGVSIVDGKFLVARGLSERYSTTLVNGAEVPSPEPTKKLVPLDVFPASLLESIVVTKSATPDKPGDFSGGAVEIRTKEFPENPIRQLTFSQGYNSQTTGRSLPFPAKRALDFFGFDNGFREPPPRSGIGAGPFGAERFAEQVRSAWNPTPVLALPNLGLGFTLGNQRPSDRFALGYVVSLTYSSGRDYSEDRLFRYYLGTTEPQRGFVYQDYRNTVDWGAVANVSLRLGSSNKLSLKNLYTRNAEELYSTNEGFNLDRNGDVRNYQMSYVERQLVQSQLAGEHLLRWLGRSRLEWKATLSQSSRNEPDNRQAEYVQVAGDGRYGLNFNTDFWYRTLDDTQRSLQADWQLPTRVLWTPMTFKVGASARQKRRAFDAYLGSFNIDQTTRPPADLQYLPPELLFTPENLGTWVRVGFPGASAQPYDANDDVLASYALVDMNIASRLRLVAGARVEKWSLDLFDGGRTIASQDSLRVVTTRRVQDILPSANLTVSLTDRLNLRLAAFKSVSRPDTRELSRDEYTEVTGSCGTVGNPDLQRGEVYNADSRLEWYPRPGEVLSVSGFYKYFQDPLLRTVTGRNGCTYGYINGDAAENFGVEMDVRKDLTFLPGALERLTVATNVTLVRSSVTISPTFGTFTPGLDLEGQSPYLVNSSVSWRSANGGVNATVLYNQFANRIVRYGYASAGVGQGPNVVEKGRGTLDAKTQVAIGRGATVSVAARNLTNARVQFIQTVDSGADITGRAIPGMSFTVGVSLVR
jgi:Carboxypeptidase regulatory-like domain/TonB-dependent Receptor Plug Domain